MRFPSGLRGGATLADLVFQFSLHEIPVVTTWSAAAIPKTTFNSLFMRFKYRFDFVPVGGVIFQFSLREIPPREEVLEPGEGGRLSILSS